MVTLIEWAQKWHISPDALRELCDTALHVKATDDTGSESRVQSLARLAAARQGKYLFRNNLGALKDVTGRVVRYGLGNDSAKLNDAFKSGDLIGWEPLDVGCMNCTGRPEGVRVARFLSVEVKRSDWKFSGTLDEFAQVAWATLVNKHGGRAVITNTPDAV